MLYLIFGFLEWYESQDSEVAHLAPLILIPISLKRDKIDYQTNTYLYSVEYSGEDVTANVTLQEKLFRDFNLELPKLDEDDTPELYFKKLKPILQAKPRWRICRHITLALLSFSKLVMYRDLNPQPINNENSIAHQPLIRDFFEGTKLNISAHSQEYSIDEYEIKAEAPPLIYDADSSQHSALIDVMEGKNLVIEGPPGTGKSQTITNLIAAALSHGKTVLFVAEKMAALEVVRNRLDEAGLGVFCLELHSNKTQKSELLKDIERRLSQQSNFNDSAEIDSKLQLLQQNRERLSQYAKLLNSIFGGMGLSIHEILWTHQRLANSLHFPSTKVHNLFFPNAELLTRAEFATINQKLEIYGKQLSIVTQVGGTLKKHPWFGLTNNKLTFADANGLLTTLSKLRNSAQLLNDSIESLNNRVGCNVSKTPQSLREFLQIKLLLPDVSQEVIRELVPRLVNLADRQTISSFCERFYKYKNLYGSLDYYFESIPQLEASHLIKLSNLCQKMQDTGWAANSINTLEDYVSKIEGLAAEIENASLFFQQIVSHLNIPIPFTVQGISLLLTLFAILEETPFDSLHLREKAFEKEGSVAIVQAAKAEAEIIKSLKHSLAARFHLPSVPSPEQLSSFAKICASSGFFAFLNAEYRAAKKTYTGFLLRKQKISKEQMRDDYRFLADYFVRHKAFDSNPLYQTTIGGGFNGVDTPFHLITKLLSWYENVRQKLPGILPLQQQLKDFLFLVERERLQLLDEQRKLNLSKIESLKSLLNILDSLSPELPGILRQAKNEDLSIFLHQIRSLALSIRKIITSLQQAGVRSNLSINDIQTGFSILSQVNSLRNEIENDQEAADILGSCFAGIATQVDSVHATNDFINALSSSSIPPEVQQWLLSQDVDARIYGLRQHLQRLEDDFSIFIREQETFSIIAETDPKEWYGFNDQDGRLDFHSIVTRADIALLGQEHLAHWLDYIRSRKSINDANLSQLVLSVEDGLLLANDLSTTFVYIFYNSILNKAFETHRMLTELAGLDLDETRKRFAEIDKELIKLFRIRAAYRISRRRVPQGISRGPVKMYTELGLIYKELSKQKRHIPIRSLLDRSGKALQALKPCFMMSPLSVAQYLKPGGLKFDLIVMDEASQIKPEDALGAVARGSQVVVVGDPKQLPPTSFFERVIDESAQDEEENSVVEDAESILDVASFRYQPIRQLRWHYRSRHHSLISFSNKEFYDGRLLVFPSPQMSDPYLGVQFEAVPDGVYENQSNLIEAQRIVEAVLNHARNNPHDSLGIVTFNLKQREIIEALIDKQAKQDFVLQEYLKEHNIKDTSTFVKNLENVQGDEFDVIFISVTYGKDATGKLYQRFGPIIRKDTGHRRLNVLITRARKRIVVFSSIDPEDIRIQPGSAWGLKALKSYLTFAKTGTVDSVVISDREPDSDFEIVVAHALREKGLEVIPQVGVAGYWIDLAVKHPNKGGSFILGIECDGATYHSSYSTRDRDRLRQAVLEGLGWKIHRIWSTDWFKNSRHEIEKILSRINSILSKA